MPKPRNKFLLIAGPCVLGELSTAVTIARKVKAVADELGWHFIFKASYDKANRTSLEAGRGPGLEAGLAMLGEVRRRVGVPVISDVHSVEEAVAAGRVLDMLQIPAFLCRQTDLLVAAARTGRPVSVKKGQFLAPGDIDAVAAKLVASGCQDYWITERGTTFGYHNLVVDMRGLAWMRRSGHRVIFDATHSVQRPGSTGRSTGGDGDMAPVLARAAMAAGIDGLFIETHPDPSQSPSDGPNMIPLARLPKILRQLARIHEASC